MNYSSIELALLITAGAAVLHAISMVADRFHRKSELYAEQTQPGTLSDLVSWSAVGATTALKIGVPTLYFSCGLAWLVVIYETSLEECVEAEFVSATVKDWGRSSTKEAVLSADELCARIVLANDLIMYPTRIPDPDKVPVEELPELIDGEISVDGEIHTAKLEALYLFHRYSYLISVSKPHLHQVRVCRPKWVDVGGWKIDSNNNELVTDLGAEELGTATPSERRWKKPKIEVSGLWPPLEYNLEPPILLSILRDEIRSSSCNK